MAVSERGKKEIVKRKHTTITIPASLFEKMEKSISKTGFSSVSEYATYLLREVVAQIETGSKRKVDKDSKNQEETVVAKLRALGYI
jgi:Arc/MetJ-type ribon-helix-helix transcriptional regulator